MPKAVKITLAVVFVVIAFGAGFIYHQIHTILNPKGGPHGGSSTSIPQTLIEVNNIFNHPEQGFPGQHKTTILCMGIDDSWTNNDEVYTSHSRTDTLFLLTLNFDNKTASMLSIPRDTYTHIAGTDYSSKINSAFSMGGPQRSMATVAEMTGIQPDHYLVLNINATKSMVNALGGVEVNVEHQMDYDDKWGHLSIHLKPGQQHLDGDDAVAFARYRHGNAGAPISPEDGDERRMYRQHILMRAMVDKAKNLMTIAEAPTLVDTAMQSIRTDLTRDQLFDLGSMYRHLQPDQLLTGSLPGDSFKSAKGAWDYKLDPDKMKAYVDWFVNGNSSAARALVPVVVKNGAGVTGLASHAVDQLKAAGYTDVTVGGNATMPVAATATAPVTGAHFNQTTLVDSGVPYTGAMTDVASLLGVASPVLSHRVLKPNHLGWTPSPTLSVTLGLDYAQSPAGTVPTASSKVTN